MHADTRPLKGRPSGTVSQNSAANAISRSTYFQASPVSGRPSGLGIHNLWVPASTRSSTGRTPTGVRAPVFPRKEVIQPQLPLRLPCYDFTPIIDPTFDGCLLKEVSPPASGIANFRGVTGGVYKAREHIHRGVADPRLLATPPSWRRVSASNPNRDRLFGIRSPSQVCSPLYRPM